MDIRFTEMLTNETDSRLKRLSELASMIDSHTDWWRFPEEPPIRGFLGSDPLFFVGDQPSTSSWEFSNPNRRAFYGLLGRLGASNAHITDLYKKRGLSGSLKDGLPADFDAHLRLFREELEILRPTRVIALGRHAYDLLQTHVPELRRMLGQIWHFAYAVRYGRVDEWQDNAHAALKGLPLSLPAAPPPTISQPRGASTRSPPRHRTQREIMRENYAKYRGNPEAVISAYANAERNGEAPRSSNSSGMK